MPLITLVKFSIFSDSLMVNISDKTPNSLILLAINFVTWEPKSIIIIFQYDFDFDIYFLEIFLFLTADL